ncbi:MAG: hypothetical protein GY754_09210 [bacterium]|nr:hypothetical protein [bacterium]
MLLKIENNSALSSLGLNALNSVDKSFSIQNNPELPNSPALALKDQVSVGGEVTIAGNKE